MKAIEIIGIMALYTLFYNLLLFFIKYRRKADVKKEQVTIEASLDANDDIIKLKARNEFLESEIEKFATICDGITAANKKCLDEFEAYVRLTQDEPAIDWSVPQAFPEGYKIREGIRVIKVGEDDGWVKKGSEGITIETSSIPFIKWLNKDYDLLGSGGNHSQSYFKLAPLNHTDHPNHPDYVKR